ncbi:MAG: hypothetical protein FJY80_06400, partial [Candidatus Aminicenantes bacterium]|nr:hypothetical protein [Candidatus Aminicenantes bacterium]
MIRSSLEAKKVRAASLALGVSVGLCAGGPALGSPQWKGTMTKEGEGLVTPPDPAYAVKKFD